MILFSPLLNVLKGPKGINYREWYRPRTPAEGIWCEGLGLVRRWWVGAMYPSRMAPPQRMANTKERSAARGRMHFHNRQWHDAHKEVAWEVPRVKQQPQLGFLCVEKAQNCSHPHNSRVRRWKKETKNNTHITPSKVKSFLSKHFLFFTPCWCNNAFVTANTDSFLRYTSNDTSHLYVWFTWRNLLYYVIGVFGKKKGNTTTIYSTWQEAPRTDKCLTVKTKLFHMQSQRITTRQIPVKTFHSEWISWSLKLIITHLGHMLYSAIVLADQIAHLLTCWWRQALPVKWGKEKYSHSE